MSVWTQITGSFYIHEYKDETYKRLKSFIEENKHLLLENLEGNFDFGTKEASFRTGVMFNNGCHTEIKGAAQFYMFGCLQDETNESTVDKLIPFIKALMSNFEVRLGQVLLYDGSDFCSIQVKNYDETIKINGHRR